MSDRSRALVMRPARHVIAALVAALAIGLMSPPPAAAAIDTARITQVHVSPTYQRNTSWCWVASITMALAYYHVPNVNPAGHYQCGVVGLLAGRASPCFANCNLCNLPSGSAATVADAVNVYAQWTSHMLPGSATVTAYATGALSQQTVKQLIDNDELIIVGFAPGGGQPHHMSLISGYSDQVDGFYVVVDDPWPYDVQQYGPDPYLAAGQDALARFQYGLQWSTLNSWSWIESVVIHR